LNIEDINNKVSKYSLDDLKRYQKEAIQFFGAQLILLKDSIFKITDERQTKGGVLLMSCGQTGTALLQLSNQIDFFTSESVMLARAFMEKITNFCYVSICDETEYRAFILHPIYKYYHNIITPRMEDDLDYIEENFKTCQEKQKKLKKIPIVQEALSIFSETKPNLNWTKKNLSQRIGVIEKWGKMIDVFFTINKLQYYSDASETLHGSLYGCTYDTGVFNPELNHNDKEELNKKLYKENACILLHLGMLIHETFTLISYSSDIKVLWKTSYRNRGKALNLLFHILEKDNKTIQ
jgi:hypothetical protein